MSAPAARRRVAASAVALRPAEEADCQRVWNLRNDEETRRASFDTAPVPWDTHRSWFADALKRNDRRIFMVLVHDRPEGVARLDIEGGAAEVSIHVAPEWRGSGVGTTALDRLAAIAFQELGVARLVASVKADNAVSRAAFARAGFGEAARDGAVVTFERRR